jgi:hypothetical protein
MARNTSTKTDSMKLPKYLKLAKGTMWFDNLGEHCSNISLHTMSTQFVGRGYISDTEWDSFTSEGYSNRKEIAKDANNNESSEAGAYGYVAAEDDKSFFCTTDVPKNKLGNIITAFKTGVLIAYDPKKEEEEKEEKKILKNFAFKKDGDLVFTGKNKRMYDKLNNSQHDDLITFIKTSGLSAKTNLMDLYDYEIQGFNRLNRPRATILDSIRAKLNQFGPGMSAITVEKSEE